MNIPTEFYLKRHKWTVEIVEGEYLMHDDCRAVGLTCEESRTIQICGSLGNRKLLATFMHEFLHACEFEYGLKIPHRLIYDLDGPLGRIVSELLMLNCC